MFKHLFVPVDGSELSVRAMDASIELARQLGARITGFVVEPDIPLAAVNASPTTFVHHVEVHQAKINAHATGVLNQFAERAAAAGVAFESEYRQTDQVDAVIPEVAAMVGADLIVMVTHGRGALGELWFGSHTKSVMGRTQLPLLVLR